MSLWSGRRCPWSFFLFSRCRLCLRARPAIDCAKGVRLMSRNAERLRQLFVDLDRLDFDAVAAHCADDCVYDDMPYAEATAVGPAAIRAKLELGLGTLERIPTTIHELVEAGDTIM